MPKFIESRVYLKPLFQGKKFKGDVKQTLNLAKKDLLRRIKRELTQTAFSDRAKRALSKAIKIEVKPSSLRIVTNHPAFRPLTEGQKKAQMKWLTKATRPIPIVTEDGKVIFRWATARSMRDGRWIHPGRDPSSFIDRAKKVSREVLKKKISEEINAQVRSAWRK